MNFIGHLSHVRKWISLFPTHILYSKIVFLALLKLTLMINCTFKLLKIFSNFSINVDSTRLYNWNSRRSSKSSHFRGILTISIEPERRIELLGEVELGQNTINSTPHRLALDSSLRCFQLSSRVFVFPHFFYYIRLGILRSLPQWAHLVNENFRCCVKKNYSFLSIHIFIECEKWTATMVWTKRSSRRCSNLARLPALSELVVSFVRVFMFYQL